MKKIAILGSTGSIGTQTLEIVREQKDICVRALAAGNNICLLYTSLKEVLKRAENHCKLQKEKEPLIIRVNGENCYVPKEEILYAENYARKVILHLGERQIAYYAKMGELEEQLGESFFRVHRGYLVNLRAVRSYHTAGVVLKNGEEILMAKSKFQKFEEVYMDFLRNSD